MRGTPEKPLAHFTTVKTYVGTYIYIYIYIEREREREREISLSMEWCNLVIDISVDAFNRE